MKIFAGLITAVVLAIVGYIYYAYSKTHIDVDEPQEILQSAASDMDENAHQPIATLVDQAPAEERIDTAGFGPIPDLEASDTYLQDILADEKSWQPITAAKNLIRHAVTTIELLARDENPNSQLSFLQPHTPIQVTQRDGKHLLAPENYTRYQPLIDFAEGIDSDRAALLYRHLFPVITQAYDELGNSDQAFAEKFDAVMGRILNFVPPQGDIELSGQPGNYIFTDEALEALNSLEKALIRIGPTNTKRVQEKIQQFQQALTRRQ